MKEAVLQFWGFTDDLEWQQHAACRKPGVDPDWFYPEKGGSLAKARAVCADCPVLLPCRLLVDKLEQCESEAFGIWGGETPTGAEAET